MHSLTSNCQCAVSREMIAQIEAGFKVEAQENKSVFAGAVFPVFRMQIRRLGICWESAVGKCGRSGRPLFHRPKIHSDARHCFRWSKRSESLKFKEMKIMVN